MKVSGADSDVRGKGMLAQGALFACSSVFVAVATRPRVSGPDLASGVVGKRPRLGSVFDLRPKTQLFVQYRTAAVPPATLFSLSQANAAFEMTTGKSVEGGIKSGFWQDRANVTFAAFRIEQDDIVTRDPAIPTPHSKRR